MTSEETKAAYFQNLVAKVNYRMKTLGDSYEKAKAMSTMDWPGAKTLAQLDAHVGHA